MRKIRPYSFSSLQKVLMSFYAVMIILPVTMCLMAYFQSLQYIIEQEMKTQSSLATVSM